MDRFHFSSAEQFDSCPQKFAYTYIQGLETIPTDDPQNPLILGTALHKGMETDVETAIQEYYDSYNIITDLHVNEAMKLEYWIQKMKEQVPDGLHEVNFKNEVYEGTADLLVPATKYDVAVDNGLFDLYDYKYSNNIEHYMKSRQLHVYKYMIERITGKRIRKMFFVFVPKVYIKQRKDETLFKFRQRIMSELEKKQIQIKEVTYDESKVDSFFKSCMKIGLEKEFNPNPTNLCDWCQFKDYCQKGNEINMLPSNERRPLGQTKRRRVGIYGRPQSGKTVFCDQCPNPLNLNTDGNITNVTMPFLPIKDTMEGRQRVMAWTVFKNALDELEKTAGQNGFDTIVVDLVEDLYESCRLYMYDKLGITHESDDSFRAWDKVRTEFLSTMRKLMNLDYENIILVFQEDMSKDITRKSGDKITSIKPNITDKIATKLAGMVDIFGRVVVEEDGSRTFNFKSSEVVFGGGRLRNITKTQIPLDWNELCAVFDEANSCGQSAENIQPTPAEVVKDEPRKRARKTTIEPKEFEDDGVERPWEEQQPEPQPVEEPKKRTRRTRTRKGQGE